MVEHKYVVLGTLGLGLSAIGGVYLSKLWKQHLETKELEAVEAEKINNLVEELELETFGERNAEPEAEQLGEVQLVDEDKNQPLIDDDSESN